MKRLLSMKLFAPVLILMLLLAACGGGGGNSSESNADSKAKGGSDGEFPKQVVVSVYDVGSSGYAETSAVANAITTEYGTQFRLLPSGTGVGRMNALKDNTATFGRLGDEYQFAYRAEEEFAAKNWGPQDIKVVWPVPAFINGAVLEKSGIKKPEDLKGKKVPQIAAGASINIKVEALLAAGGLTFDDVQVVELTSYNAQADALKQGQIDVAMMLPGASSLIELDEMQGISWIELPEDPEDAKWKAIQEVVPWLVPVKWDVGAGLEKGDPKVFAAYPYPVVARGDVPEDVVYEMMKRIEATFDQYKDASASNVLWSREHILVEPLGVPFHEGAIRYFKDEGLWKDEYDQKNEELIQYGEELKEKWQQALEEAEKQGIDDKEFANFWLEFKEQ